MEKKERKSRKPKDGKVRENVVSLKLADDEIEKINIIAEYLDVPKTALIRNFVLYGLEDAELFRKLGILSIVKNLNKTSEFLKKFKTIKKENITKK